MKFLLSVSLLFIFMQQASAQIDLQCDGRDKHSLYLLDYNGKIYRVDSVDSSPSDAKMIEDASSPLNNFAGGISINNNLNDSIGEPVVYIVNQSNEYFYDTGSSWVDTHHKSGNGSAFNPGGTFDHIYNLDGINGVVYSYTGAGDGIAIISNLPNPFTGVFDVAVDNMGNFYIFFTHINTIVAYNPAGIAIDTFTTTGNNKTDEPGFAIIGDRLYEMDSDNSIYEGIRTGKNFNFTAIKNFPSLDISDIASCPQAGEALAVFKDPTAPHFAVYPNPSNSVTVIKLDNTSLIQIYDCLGREKLSANTVGQTNYNFSVSDWSPGMYFVSATSSSGEKAFSKLVVK